MTDLNVLNVDTYHKVRASSVGSRFRPQWFFSAFFFFFFFFSFIIVILNYCKVDYKVFIIRNNKLIYLSRMKSCRWGWSCYHYSLAQRPISRRIHVSCYFINHMQVRNLSNRLRVNKVCEWAWVSIPGERDLPKSLNLCSRLELRSHVQVRTHAGTHAHRQARARTPYYRGTQTKTKVDIQYQRTLNNQVELNALSILR